MRSHLVLASLLIGATVPSAAATLIVTSLGDGAGTCPSASNCTLRAAVLAAAANDRIEFDATLGFPATLTLTGGELTVNRTLTLAGPGAGKLTVRAGVNSRVIALTAGVLTLEDLTLDRGRALGANGMNGSTADRGADGDGADGGCISAAAGTELALLRTALRDCLAQGGQAGNGGVGISDTFAGVGGAGGNGGDARGGAIFSRGVVSLTDSSVSESTARGGDGGGGGDGGDGSTSEGTGGAGGTGGVGRGGAIALTGSAALMLRNSTLFDNAASGGSGGDGGAGGNGSAIGQGVGGAAGAGGAARGGQVFIDTPVQLADFEFASLGPSDSGGGSGGDGGAGSPIGTNGASGATQGELVFTLAVTRARHSIFVGDFPSADCQGTVMISGANLDSDDSCGSSTLNGNYAPHFEGPTPVFEAGRAVLRPRAGSPVIDAADDCLDLDAMSIATDQSGRVRPQDGDDDLVPQCDVGAVEYGAAVFRDGFES